MKVQVLISVLVLGVASAKADNKFACPITKSAQITFAPTWTQALLFVGTENLFTLFPGNWQTTQKNERGYRIPKIAWFTETYDLRQELGHSSLTITGRRLDADSGPLQFGGANTAGVEKDKIFMTSEFYVPTLGCWEVTGHFHGTDLTIVVDLK